MPAGWRLEVWLKSFGVPFDIKGESRLRATKTAVNGAMFIDKGNCEPFKRVIESAADMGGQPVAITKSVRHGAV